MALDRGVADQLRVEEHRHHHRHVLRMRAGAVGPVVEKDVARIELRLAADRLHRRVDAEGERAHEDRQARRLGEKPHLRVVDGDREVEHLVDHRREGGADQRHLHLVRRRIERMPDHLGGDRIGRLQLGGAAHAAAVDFDLVLQHG